MIRFRLQSNYADYEQENNTQASWYLQRKESDQEGFNRLGKERSEPVRKKIMGWTSTFAQDIVIGTGVALSSETTQNTKHMKIQWAGLRAD